MKIFLQSLRAFGASFALVLLGALFTFTFAAVLPLPSIPGPFLGDSFNNLYTITLAYIQDASHQNSSQLSVSQTSGQANCTQLDSSAFQDIRTSAAGGFACLPTALSGKRVTISNETAQAITLYPSPASAVPPTADTVNGGASYAFPTS